MKFIFPLPVVLIAFTAIAQQAAGPKDSPQPAAQVHLVATQPAGPTTQVSALQQVRPAITMANRGDDALARAEAYVAKSDRYLHHSKLSRGMKGYGLTVMAGTKIVRFEAEIVSVMSNFGPHQDVILAQLSGLGLEKSGIVAGMSGSPVFVTDPADGKDKMIGAVAYGWFAPKEPMCGIQPITQMLAVGNVLSGDMPPLQVAQQGGDNKDSAFVGRSPLGRSQDEILAAVLDPKKIDFLEFLVSGQVAEKSSAGPRLVPLRTPLMVSGLGGNVLARHSKTLEMLGMVPVQSGGAGGTELADDQPVKLEPGSGIAIPLADGDSSLSAVGTVTEVIGDKVLAFGHAFFSEGQTAFPMGPAYIHTVVSGVVESFKLGAILNVTGTLNRDENVGIAGNVGQSVATIPMSVRVAWKDSNQMQDFHFNIVRHRMFTPILMGMLAESSCIGWKNCPQEHTVSYRIEIDFGKLGKYVAQNVSSNSEISDLVSDLMRPVAALINDRLAPPPDIKSINVEAVIDNQPRYARLIEMKLDGRVYKPGEKITGNIIIQPFRQQRQAMSFEFDLPADVQPGKYNLSACDAQGAMSMQRSEMPHQFMPRTQQELFEMLQRVVSLRGDRVYLRMPLREGGFAIRSSELPDLPASKAGPIIQDQGMDTSIFTRSLVREVVGGDFTFSGNVNAVFEVTKEPKQVITHDKSDK